MYRPEFKVWKSGIDLGVDNSGFEIPTLGVRVRSLGLESLVIRIESRV
jgi:hypothetical protein